MKEIWDLAISGQVLPFTLLLIPIAMYWLLAMLGAVNLDFLDVDLDGDAHLDLDASVAGGEAGGESQTGHHHDASTSGPVMGFFVGCLRLVNATEVPVMAVLSILFVLVWGCAMIGNLVLNPGGAGGAGTLIGLGSVVAAIGLTRLVTTPLKPFFRMLKNEGSENRPVVGRSGVVRSFEVTEKGGQVAIEEGGESILLNARLAPGAAPLERGTEVIVYKYDQESGVYYVRNLTSS